MARRPKFEDRAARALNRSLAPNLHASPIWNAVALSFFNPGMSLDKALDTAEAIDELRKATTKPRRKIRP